MSFASKPMTPGERLAVGVGDINESSLQDLRDFCKIVYPVEAKCSFDINDREKLKAMARKYLHDATARDLMRNFHSLPSADLHEIDAKVKQNNVDIFNIDFTLKNLKSFLANSKKDTHRELAKEVDRVLSIS
jgi:hypothetical protein